MRLMEKQALKKKICEHCNESVSMKTYKKHKNYLYNPVTKTWQVSTTKQNEVLIFQCSSDEEMLEQLDSNGIPMEGMYENDASVPHNSQAISCLSLILCT